MVELVIAFSLLLGGVGGWVLSQDEEKKEQVEKIEPEHWPHEFHKKFLRECATQCRKSGSKFKHYEPLSGDCQCS